MKHDEELFEFDLTDLLDLVIIAACVAVVIVILAASGQW